MSANRRILIVSFGSIGKRHLRNARELLPEADIAVFRQHVRGSNEVPDGANQLFYDLDQAITFNPDAVVIASPASEHIKYSEIFLKEGVSLFIEKPLSISSKGLGSFLEAAYSSDSFIMVAYVLRFLPALHFVRSVIAEEQLGDIRTAHVQVGQYLPDWRPTTDYRKGVSAQKALGGGALLELSHELDYSLWLFGEPDTVLCSTGTLSDLEIDVEDSAHVILEYGVSQPQKRVLVQLDFLQRVAHMALQIVGSKATLQADLIKEKVSLYSPEHLDGIELETPRLKEGNEIYLRQFDFFFFKCFEEYKPIFEETPDFSEWVDLRHASQVMNLVDCAKQSNLDGKRSVFVKAGV